MDALIGLLFVIAMIVFLRWLWRSIGRPYMDQVSKVETEKRAASESRRAGGSKVQAAKPNKPADDVTVVERDFTRARLIDLRSLPAMDLRAVGTAYCLGYEERDEYAADEYLLVREPDNPHDSDAVAVYSRGRRVGWLSAVKAEKYAPLLDVFGADAYRVGGTTREGKTATVILLPTLPALRAHVRNQ